MIGIIEIICDGFISWENHHLKIQITIISPFTIPV